MRIVLLLVALATSATAQPWTSEIVPIGADNRLEYVADGEGNRVPDFSVAGYRGGGVPIPSVPTVVTVSPVDGDDTASIQAAIAEVEARTPNAQGIRGAVELAAGTYQVNGTLEIRENGVVLRGAGGGEDPATNTVLSRSGANQDPIVYVGRRERESDDALIRRVSGRGTATVSADLLPVGTRTFDVETPGVLAVGDDVVMFHAATLNWINAVDRGATFGDDGWRVGEMPIAFARTVESIDGATVTLDAPLFYRMDKAITTPYLYIRDMTGVIKEVGVEDLRIDIETTSTTDETQAANAVVLSLVENAWVRGVTALHFWHAGVSVQNSRLVSVLDSRAIDPHSLVEGSRRYNFEVQRSQLVLFQGNYANNARHAYVGNGETLDSGIVFLDNTSEDAFTSSEAHRRWGMGFLYDNHVELGSTGTNTSDRRIHLGNRGNFGTGHGWSCANCVVWNAQMNGALVIVEKPPTAQNYAIGVQGNVTNRGPFFSATDPYIEGTNEAGLDPRSLYLRQLQDRQRPVSTETGERGEILLLPPSPNPASGRVRFGFELAAPADARLTVFDVLGREVSVAVAGSFSAGRHHTTVDTSGLAPGVYVARLTTGAATRAARFTVAR